MSDPVNVTPAPATVTLDTQSGAPVAPPAAAPAAPPPPAAAAAAASDGEPNWLPARLERERKAVLKALGVENVDDAKAALAELAAKRDADKSAAQKAAELDAALKATKAENEALSTALAAHVKGALEPLTDAQRAAVLALAPDDPAAQLRALEALRPTWASPASAPPAVAAPPTATPPADTSAGRSAPNDGAATSPPDHKAIHAELEKTNPVAAARYAVAHGVFSQ